MIKLKFKSEFFKSSNKFIFYIFYFFFSYTKKCLKFYQLNIIKKIKKDYRKKLVRNIKILLKKNKKKGNNMVEKVTKTSQKMKNKNLLSIEKNIIE